ncbi:MAG: ATP-binding protein [Pseudomonadota bacterium]|nr:ATP-binding protein [Pseudomonadota bacterium]
MADANTHYPRVIHPQLSADMRLYPVVAVMGARQVGKSTMCQEIAEARGFARRTLDERDVREQAIADPEGFLADLGDRGAFIDEVQRAPDLMLAIKAVVDRDRRNGQYLLSGSNQPKVGTSVSDSLVGRATYRTLRPLTLSELRFDEELKGWSFLFGPDEAAVIAELEQRAASSGRLDWRSVVLTGGFPRAVAAPPEQRLRILDDYVEIFSRRDILEILEVESAPRLEAFVRLTAARTGQELNVTGLSNDLGTPVTTIRRWLEALQRSYLIELIPPYSRNSGQRVIKAPKLYSVDAALAIAASRDTSPTGFHLETAVASDLFVWKDGAPTRDLYHWRLSSGQEVDFILEENGHLLPVEVKASESVGADEAKHLVTFCERHANAPRGLLISSDPQIRVIRLGILACPWWAVL